MDDAKTKATEMATARAKLSEVAARTNLDKQSTARLMAGAMGAVSRITGMKTLGEVLEEMALVAKAMQQTRSDGPNDVSPLTSRECAMLLTGWIGAIGQVADIDDVRTAAKWLAERDDEFWKMISEQVTQARAIADEAVAHAVAKLS